MISNSCESPIFKPPSASIVKAPVVVSAASALKKFPPAIILALVLVVLDTSTAGAEVELPSNTPPSVLLSVIPALISANPVCVDDGVNVSFESMAVLVLPTYIEDTTLSPPELPIDSIFQPESVCPEV